MPETKREPIVLGILNVTPDSFSDGGRYFKVDSALRRAEELEREGAHYVDVGGESTRPGSRAVSLDEEWNRVIPVVEAITKRLSIQVSVDTQKYEVARDAVQAGATVINDVSGGSDIRMAELARDKKCRFILMHMLGEPATMQNAPRYPGGVLSAVRSFLEARVRAFEEVGVSREMIWVDPGFGFGKTVEDNLELLRHIEQLDIAGGLLVGTSRKSFLAKVLNDPDMPFSLRHEGTLVTNLYAWLKGANIFRVHEPGALLRALKTWGAIE